MIHDMPDNLHDDHDNDQVVSEPADGRVVVKKGSSVTIKCLTRLVMIIDHQHFDHCDDDLYFDDYSGDKVTIKQHRNQVPYHVMMIMRKRVINDHAGDHDDDLDIDEGDADQNS